MPATKATNAAPLQGQAARKAKQAAKAAAALAAKQAPATTSVANVPAPTPATPVVTPVVATQTGAVPLPPMGNGKGGVARHRDLPRCAKRTTIFTALEALGAVSPATAQPGKVVAAKAGCKVVFVRHYCYHAGPTTSGLAGIVATNCVGVPGYGFYLTPAGVAYLAGLQAAAKAASQPATQQQAA
jgi:hypothetical protein